MFYNYISIALNQEEKDKIDQLKEKFDIGQKDIFRKGLEILCQEKGVADEPADTGKAS